ncbi:MAG TPA: hypothetical protein VFI59_09670 [Actinomycetota bacterium]|nr:hypothetical protein [Actinomycetota bacterium]
MSTDWAEYDDDSLEDHLEMAVGLVEQDEDAWSDFHSEIVAEREKRIQTTKKAEAERRRREAARYAASPQGKLAALKKDLKVAECALAAAERPETLARVHPDTARDLDPLRTARVEAAARVADLKSQIEVAEKRLPFTKTTDDQLLDLAAEGEAILAPLREAVAKHDAQAREQGIEDNSFAAQKARRDLAAAEADHGPILDEMGWRKSDKQNAVFTRDRETKTALKPRQQALERWTTEERRLKAMLDDPNRSGFLDVEELRTASKNVAEITEYVKKNPPPTAGELARARAVIEADQNLVPVAPGTVEITSW